jgi:autoinducer 2 (AI-2) kinase
MPRALSPAGERRAAQADATTKARRRGLLARIAPALRALVGRAPSGAGDPAGLEPLDESQVEAVLRRFVELAVVDDALRAFAAGRQVTTHYVLEDARLTFHLGFRDGVVAGGLGDPPAPAEVQLRMDADVLDGMFTGWINAAGAALSGKIAFDGDAILAMTVQRAQKDLTRLYREARGRVIS